MDQGRGFSFAGLQELALLPKSTTRAAAFLTLICSARVWYDSAGPTYFAQVKGLLGYGVPTSQLVFGSVSQRWLVWSNCRLLI